MLPLRRAILALFSAAMLLGLAWGCAASNSTGSNGGTSGGGSPAIVEAGSDVKIVHSDSGEAGEDSLGLNLLCGRARCVPDQPGACADYVPPALESDASVESSLPDSSLLDGAVSSQAGQTGEGGAAGEGSGGAAGAAGAAGAVGTSGAGGAADESVAGGASGSGGGTSGPAPEFSCQVQRSAAAPRSVVTQCAVAGPGGVNAPCLTSGDCGWDSRHGALACVGDASSGLCQPYCCLGDATCAVGSYCAERPLRDALTNGEGLRPGQAAVPAVMIPVCVPAENCDLSTPYPCPAGTQCACGTDTACVVVRADGTTTCAVPGTGKVGDPCPCAWGHVCSVATNQCLKLCYTRGASSCGTGTCQASAELPDGWGVCVGAGLPSGG